MAIPWPLKKVVCLYEVLGLSTDCSAEEIRSAYKKLALQRHPDKLVQTGEAKIEAEATAAFQELQNAYEILSDIKQRALYDYHRNRFKINLNSSSSRPAGPAQTSDRHSKAETSGRESKEDTSGKESKNLEKESSGFIPLHEDYNLKEFSFVSGSVYSVNLGYFANSVYCFYVGYSDSGRGFYKVYGDMFKKIYNNEVDFARRFHMPLPREGPPSIGNLKSSGIQVDAFYKYWLQFATGLEFYIPKHYKNVHYGEDNVDELVSPEKISPRHKRMEEKARKDYNASIRILAAFVKERDIRVIEMEEGLRVRKREEKKLTQLKDMERSKEERAMSNKEVKVKPVHVEEDEEDLLDEKELYCVICGKDFKSIKQRKIHDKSMEHKQQMEEWWELVDDVEEENEQNAL